MSEAVQDYAKAIYSLHRRTRQARGHLGAGRAPGRVARLGVRDAQAAGSLGLVTHQPYRGTELTEAGERVALEVIRHHRLLELYLAEALGMSWDRVHAEAEVLEHAISPELSELIAEKLGHPTHDPHGDPIPTADGSIDEQETVPLAELEPGQSGVFTRISDSDPEMLRYLSERGIAPGDAWRCWSASRSTGR